MENKTIITISRQFGSGGREIGKKIADQLGIPFYDKELIEIAAKESGMDKELFEEDDARTSKGFRLLGALGYSLGGPLSTITELSLNDRLYLVQEEVIKGVACEGSCVIVGRCADYILAGRENTINVFIHAPQEVRVKRIMELHHLNEADALKTLNNSDKERGNHYFRYTDQKWGKAQNYDVCINSALMGIEKTAEMLADMAKIEVRD